MTKSCSRGPTHQDFQHLPEPERRRLLPAERPWGLTAFRRQRNLVSALYEELVRLIAPLLLTPEQGAETVLHLACSPEVEGVSGQYFERCRPVRPSAAARDDAAARRLWEESARLVGLS